MTRWMLGLLVVVLAACGGEAAAAGRKAPPPAPSQLAVTQADLGDSVRYSVTWPNACDADGCAQSYVMVVALNGANVRTVSGAPRPYVVTLAKPVNAGTVSFSVTSVRKGLPSLQPRVTTVPIAAKPVPLPPPPPPPDTVVTPPPPPPDTTPTPVPVVLPVMDSVTITPIVWDPVTRHATARAQWWTSELRPVHFGGTTANGPIGPSQTSHYIDWYVPTAPKITFYACVYAIVDTLRGPQLCATPQTFEIPVEPPPPPPPDTVIVDTLPPPVDTLPTPPVDTLPTPIPPESLPPVEPRPTGIDSVTVGSAELPRVWVDTRMPSGMTGMVINVPAGGDLQGAINGAQRGDIIQLPEDAVFTGNFRLPAKSGTGWIIIRTNTQLTGEGQRMTPTLGAKLARIETANAMPALETVGGGAASYYRIIGVEFASTAAMTYNIVSLHNHPATRVEDIPTHIILDRVIVTGHYGLDTQRCVGLNTRYSAVIDSWLEHCHHRGSDAQAIGGWNGSGPYKINNNYLEASGENVMFGGADPIIVGLVPSDIEMRFNHIKKPLEWVPYAYSVKNSVETKNVSRWLIEANVIENNWKASQTGFMTVFKSSNQSGRCNWCRAEDVNYRWNRMINTPSGFNFKGLDDYSFGGGIHMRRVTVYQVEAIEVGFPLDGSRVSGTDYRTFQFLGPLDSMTVDHVTSLTGSNQIIMFDGGVNTKLRFTNNLIGKTTYGIFGSGKGEGLGAISYFAPGATITGNVLIGARSALYPAGNFFPATLADVDPTSTAGVDRAELNRRLQGVVVPR